MNGISVVHGSPQAVWMQMSYAATIYMGGLVSLLDDTGNEGIIPLPAAAGASNTTDKNIPLGVAIGHNMKNPVWNSTYKCETILSATPLSSTTEFTGHGSSPFPIGGREHLVKVAIITPSTVLRAPIYNAAVGTGPTLLTVTVASGADGLDCTTNACDFTTTAEYATIYIRTGAQKGTYRILDSGHTTAHTWDTPCYGAVAVDDTAVIVPLRTSGSARAQFHATCPSFIDCGQGVGTNYYFITVLRLDLSVAGEEYVEFMFNGDNFCHNRT